jgi:cytochrome b561
MNQASKQKTRTDVPTFVLHWVMVAATAVNLATGLQLGGDSGRGLSKLLASVLPQGDLYPVHAGSGLVLAAALAIYLVFLTRAGLLRRLSLSGAIDGLRQSERRWQTVHRGLHWIVLLLLGTAFLTGGAIYFDLGINGETLQWVHYAVACAFLAYIVVHVFVQLLHGGLSHALKMFRPRWTRLDALLAAGVVGATFAGSLYAIGNFTRPTLTVGKVSASAMAEGYPNATAWAKSESTLVRTANGFHLPDQAVHVSVRGLRDAERAYLLFEWADDTRSGMYLPLKKTTDGWRAMGTRFQQADENEFMDDKFAIMIADKPGIGVASSVHIGPKPLAGQPGAANERGLHYTTDGSTMDVWYWRSARHLALGQLEDMHFAAPQAPKADDKYHGGWVRDSPCSGGAQQNFSRVSDSPFVKLKRLPKAGGLDGEVARTPDPGSRDTGDWWMMLADTVPYAAELDTHPVGTFLPSVLIGPAYDGDCADVRARGQWRDGRWRLEVSRKLDTGSKFDIAIKDGAYLWVAVFDRTQSRHSRHQQAVQLRFEE